MITPSTSIDSGGINSSRCSTGSSECSGFSEAGAPSKLSGGPEAHASAPSSESSKERTSKHISDGEGFPLLCAIVMTYSTLSASSNEAVRSFMTEMSALHSIKDHCPPRRTSVVLFQRSSERGRRVVSMNVFEKVLTAYIPELIRVHRLLNLSSGSFKATFMTALIDPHSVTTLIVP